MVCELYSEKNLVVLLEDLACLSVRICVCMRVCMCVSGRERAEHVSTKFYLSATKQCTLIIFVVVGGGCTCVRGVFCC